MQQQQMQMQQQLQQQQMDMQAQAQQAQAQQAMAAAALERDRFRAERDDKRQDRQAAEQQMMIDADNRAREDARRDAMAMRGRPQRPM